MHHTDSVKCCDHLGLIWASFDIPKLHWSGSNIPVFGCVCRKTFWPSKKNSFELFFSWRMMFAALFAASENFTTLRCQISVYVGYKYRFIIRLLHIFTEKNILILYAYLAIYVYLAPKSNAAPKLEDDDDKMRPVSCDTFKRNERLLSTGSKYLMTIDLCQFNSFDHFLFLYAFMEINDFLCGKTWKYFVCDMIVDFLRL